jgi:prepilin-type N-terminal cleavage/methylation domain-containing protein
MSRKKQGFTLIELLVVIAIIGLLASIVLVSLTGSRAKARDARGQADLRQISTALELKYSDVTPEAYPDLPTAATAITGTTVSLAPYISDIPDTNGYRVYYWYDGATGAQQKYCIYFQLESSTGYFYVSNKGSGTNAAAACLNF